MSKNVQKVSWDRNPVPGETLFLRSTSEYSSPHCHALYLGKDDTGDKVLLPTYTDGYSIVNLESIDKNAYRASGRFNIRKEEVGTECVTGYDYVFFDTRSSEQFKEQIVTVKKVEGRWLIVALPDSPSWAA